MAGTDSTRPPVTGGPTILLIDPQLDENIGTVARAMLNCGLTDLRLVRPRKEWLNEKTIGAACGADEILKTAKICRSVKEASSDLSTLYATTARGRDMVTYVVTPREAAKEARDNSLKGEKSGFMFGAERTGLKNEELTLADKIVRVPLNPAFCSLNLAQAVLLLGYEWYQSGDATDANRLVKAGQKKADKNMLHCFYDRLDIVLEDQGFFQVPEKRDIMMNKIRNMFNRADLREAEINILHGMVTALLDAPHRK